MRRRWRCSTSATTGSSCWCATPAAPRRWRRQRRARRIADGAQAHPRPAARRRGRGGEADRAGRQCAGARLLDRDRSSPATAPGCWASIRARRSSASSAMPMPTAATASPRSRRSSRLWRHRGRRAARRRRRSPAPASSRIARYDPAATNCRADGAEPSPPAARFRRGAAARRRRQAQGPGAAAAVYGIDPDKVKLLGTGLWDDSELGTEPALEGGWYAGARPRRRAPISRSASRRSTSTRRRCSRPSAMTRRRSPRCWRSSGARFLRRRAHQSQRLCRAQRHLPPAPDGVVERGLAVLEVHRAGATVIDPAPQTFATPDLLSAGPWQTPRGGFDIVVVGSGGAGLAAAAEAARLGRRVLVIEKGPGSAAPPPSRWAR